MHSYMNSSKYKYGLKKSVLSKNDKVGMLHFEQITLPYKFDLRDLYNIKAYNQLNTNSCSANAISNAIKIILQKIQSKIEPSRNFIYFNSLLYDRDKIKSKDTIQDVGASFKSCMESLNFYKFCDESLHAFDEDNICRFPSYDAYRSASNNDFITKYTYIHHSLYNFKYILSVLHKSIILGMAVYSSFEFLNETNYILKKPDIDELYLGLHGVLVVSYDDNDETFTICNSHGVHWGNNGFFKMKYDYIMDPSLCFEFWVLN